ncbi:MAG: hypothetical protein ACK5WZ_07765 [Pseudobdellovibrionaceae bacterium]
MTLWQIEIMTKIVMICYSSMQWMISTLVLPPRPIKKKKNRKPGTCGTALGGKTNWDAGFATTVKKNLSP